jgi:hypothetical protein
LGGSQASGAAELVPVGDADGRERFRKYVQATSEQLRTVLRGEAEALAGQYREAVQTAELEPVPYLRDAMQQLQVRAAESKVEEPAVAALQGYLNLEPVLVTPTRLPAAARTDHRPAPAGAAVAEAFPPLVHVPVASGGGGGGGHGSSTGSTGSDNSKRSSQWRPWTAVAAALPATTIPISVPAPTAVADGAFTSSSSEDDGSDTETSGARARRRARRREQQQQQQQQPPLPIPHSPLSPVLLGRRVHTHSVSSDSEYVAPRARGAAWSVADKTPQIGCQSFVGRRCAAVTGTRRRHNRRYPIGRPRLSRHAKSTRVCVCVYVCVRRHLARR